MPDLPTFAIIFNGLPHTLPDGTTVADLIDMMDEHDLNLIVEVNHKYIFARNYATTVLKDADRVEFINPDFGG